jgi:hypothetical protein
MFPSVKIRFFVADLKLFTAEDSFQDYIHFQAELNMLADWCELIGLPQNIRKCEGITLIGPRSQLNLHT